MSSYTLLPYNEDNLANALSGNFSGNKSKTFTTSQEVKEKRQFTYFSEYLSKEKGIGAETIIVEHEYISKDYLVDYAAYYASCFDEYPKKCNRVHFFSSKFNNDEFEDVLLELTSKSDVSEDKASIFWKSYLGYIVAKPIPIRVIGKTVLKTYPKKDSDSERHYFGNRTYHVNIFGNNVPIDSLAFLEQDGIVSVCATSAIWMMLQKASCNNYAILKTPSEITDEADIVGTHGERLFPNNGLSLNQISKSIFHSGLVTEIRTDKKITLTNSYLKRIVLAYSPIGIPLLLIMQVPYKTRDNNAAHDFHAVTVTGYKMARYIETSPSEQMSWRSDSITKLFVHDDGWGPYARLHFGDGESTLYNNWSEKFDPRQPAHLTDIVIPVYHKIRISYDNVEAIVNAVDKILWLMYKENTTSNISWDIKLNYSKQYKIQSKQFNKALAKKIHLTPMPKYIWVADCYIAGVLIFQIIFDATDVATGMFGLYAYFQKDEAKTHLNQFLTAYPKSANFFYHDSKQQFYNFLITESSG